MTPIDTTFRCRPDFRIRPLVHALALSFPLLFGSGAVFAQATCEIPAGPLGDGLARLAQRTGAAIAFNAEQVQGLRTEGFSGACNAEEGFAMLLRGTGLALGKSASGYVLVAAPQPTSAATPSTAPAEGPVLAPVRVTAPAIYPGDIPEAFPGGKVARGAQLGALGNANALDTPVSIVSFTSEFRDDTQALSVSDILKYSVSVQTPQAGAVNTTDVVYVRGFDIGSYDSTLLGLSGLLGRMPPLEAIERVELILGANTFVNGQPGAVGGSINIVPKRAGDTPISRLGFNYRTESILGSTLDVGRRFGPDDALGVRINLGFQEGNTELEDGKRRAYSRAVAIDHRTATTRLSFDYLGNDRRLPAEAWFAPMAGVSMPDPKRADRDFRQPWTFYKDTWDAAVLRGEWDITPQWSVAASFGRMWTVVERMSQVSEVINDAGDLADAYGGSLSYSRQRRTAFAGDVTVRGEIETGPLKHRVSLGLNRFGDKGFYAANGPAAPYPLPSNIYNPVDFPNPGLVMPDIGTGYDSRTRNRGLFVSDEIRLLEDRLRVVVGARQAEYRSETLGAGGGWAGDESKKKWSPALGVLYKIQPTLSVYANRLEALQGGYQVAAPASNAGTVLPPLPADQTEIGLKGETGRLGYTAAIFDIDRPNYGAFAGPTGPQGINGRQVNRGLELSLFGEASRGLRLYTSAAVIDAKLKSTAGGTNDGNRATNASRYLANAHADWDVPGIAGLAVLGGITYNSSTYVDDTNTQALKPYTRVDAGVRYRMRIAGKNTTFRLNVDNLFDRQYFVAERGTVYFGPQRTVGASVAFDL